MKINRLANKLLIGITILFILAFALSWAVLYYTQKPILLERSEAEVQNHLKTLELLLNIHIKEKQENVRVALRTAHNLLYKQGVIQITDTILKVKAKNQITKQKEEIEIPLWYYNNKTLHYNYEFVDEVQAITNNSITIFQKIPQGYLRISTNVRNERGKRGINTYIPNDSPVALNISKGLKYTGRAYVVDDWYITQYEPIFLEDEVVGMLYAGVKENSLENLRSTMYSFKYFETGIAWCLHKNGEFLVHPKKEGTFIEESFLWKSIKDKQNGKVGFEDTETGKFKWVYFIYNPIQDIYLGIEVAESALIDESMNTLLNQMSLVFGITFLVIFFLTYWLVSSSMKPLRVVRNHLKRLAKGEIPEPIVSKRKDETGKMLQSLNTLIQTFKTYAKFAGQIAENKLESQFSPSSDKDVLGNSLKRMQANLKRIANEDRKEQWESQTLNIFDRIIRQYDQDEKLLSEEFLKKFVKHFKAQAGVIYFKKKDELQILTAFAMNKGFAHREKIGEEEGLLGQSFIQKKVNYLENIPENYFNIEAGFGSISPKALLIMPIYSEGKSFGVMEIASLNPMEEYQRKTAQEVVDTFSFTLYKISLLQTSS